jgi:hypothetical protein
MYRVTVDKLFPPPEEYKNFFDKSPYPLLNYPEGDNLWEKVAQY